MTRLRWGIMGTGDIAGIMTSTLLQLGSPVTVVGSERATAARDFATTWGVTRAAGSYEEVAEADDVDVVYVATTNERHLRAALAGINNGKAVLCEKPLTVNAAEAETMLAAARDVGVFAMEAMWMRFVPAFVKMSDLVAAGALGELRYIQVSFGMIPPDPDVERRWMSRAQAGGSLLDLGVYALTLIHFLLGPPTGFAADCVLSATGVDIETAVLSRHANDSGASMVSSFSADLNTEATISGTDARLRIHAPFHHSPRVLMERRGKLLGDFDTRYDGHGFKFEIEEVERCVAAGLTESPLRRHDETLAVMKWMDEIRARCGIAFPADDR
ncbi:MAG: Gfo/Idh/MocA family oxidoreductase [Acidimicrobiia bacterium]|nr:Gfo/Idh/MocA family oxidoreductase [Acidimicrobiia bacterium]